MASGLGSMGRDHNGGEAERGRPSPEYRDSGRGFGMRALLGNHNGVVKPWYLPFDWVFVRVINEDHRLTATIAKNSAVPNVWGALVEIVDGKVSGFIKETPKE